MDDSEVSQSVSQSVIIIIIIIIIITDIFRVAPKQ